MIDARATVRRGLRIGLLLPLLGAYACSSDDNTPGNPPPSDGGALDGTVDSGADAAKDTGGAVDTGAQDADAGGADAADASDGADASDALTDGAGDDGADAFDAGPPCVAPGTVTPVTISGHLSVDTTFTCEQVYELSGIVAVDEPAVLTIRPGTTILMNSDASLIIRPGAKIMAVGERSSPIVFTSAQPYLTDGGVAPQRGDWGSVAIVGRAPGNWGEDPAHPGQALTMATPDANDWPGGFPYQAGWTDSSHITDSSGALRFVRLEYGGTVRNPEAGADTTHEMLGLYGVGSGTLLDYIEGREAILGCIFAEGGAFDARHIVCQRGGQSGGVDLSRGNKSRMQFVLVQVDPARTDEGLGFKGPFDTNLFEPITDPTVYNATLCGPNGPAAATGNPYGFFMKRQPAGRVYDTIASGFYSGVAMRGKKTGAATTELRSSILFGNFDPTTDAGNTNISYPSPPEDIPLDTWFLNASWNNATTDPGLGVDHLGCFDPTTMRAVPAAAITTKASAPPNDGFFDPNAAYIGAFKDATDTWASGPWFVWQNH
jgi:hypothetical protein